MKYESLYDDFIKLFPTYRDFIEKQELKNRISNEDGQHVKFEMVVVPFFIKLVENKDSDSLRKAFSYFEKMANSHQSKIIEVLEFTILESLIARGQQFVTKCKFYMGKETLASCNAIEKYYKLE